MHMHVAPAPAPTPSPASPPPFPPPSPPTPPPIGLLSEVSIRGERERCLSWHLLAYFYIVYRPQQAQITVTDDSGMPGQAETMSESELEPASQLPLPLPN